MKTIKPNSKLVFAKPIEQEKKTSSGLYIAPKEKFKKQFAEVVNAGSEVKAVKRHDTIIYQEYAATELDLDGEDYIIVAEEDILGIVVEVE